MAPDVPPLEWRTPSLRALRGSPMETSRRLWVLAVVLGLGGCAGEDTSQPPAGAPVDEGTRRSGGSERRRRSRPLARAS